MQKTSIGICALVACATAQVSFGQLIYQGGGKGQIEYAAEPVVNQTSSSPLWSADSFTQAVLGQSPLNDFMKNPGGGVFNTVGYGTYGNIAFTNPMADLGSALSLSASPGTYNGLAFGGGSTTVTPTSIGSNISATTPGDYTLLNACQTSKYIVGVGMGSTVGTYLSLNGVLSSQATIGSSLVTYIQDTTTNQSVILAEVLAAGGTSYSNAYVALSGQMGSPAAGANSWVQFGNGGTTYRGFASSYVPNFFDLGDNVTVTSAYAEWADPDTAATINTDSIPDDLYGATLPSTVLFGSAVEPEPSAALLAAGALLPLTLRRRRIPT